MARYVLTAANCGPVDFVRAGEWSVVDTTKFSGPPLCHYWDDNTQAQCEAHRSCKAFRSCNKGPKPDKDCQQKEGGQTTCAPPHQVKLSPHIMVFKDNVCLCCRISQWLALSPTPSTPGRRAGLPSMISCCSS